MFRKNALAIQNVAMFVVRDRASTDLPIKPNIIPTIENDVSAPSFEIISLCGPSHCLPMMFDGCMSVHIITATRTVLQIFSQRGASSISHELQTSSCILKILDRCSNDPMRVRVRVCVRECFSNSTV